MCYEITHACYYENFTSEQHKYCFPRPIYLNGNFYASLLGTLLQHNGNVVYFQVNALDLAPNYAGSLTSLVNTTSTFAGIATPYLIGLMTPNVSILSKTDY